jgi:uncharacterized protein YndB with AHSA1/START domain
MSTQEALDIHREIIVTCDPQHAFETFTLGIATWWPLETHSVASDILEVTPHSVRFEPGPAGRIVELLPDGSEAPWAHVRAWEPPSRLLLAWKPNPDATAETEIEVSFTAAATGDTLVTLEHRGFASLAARDEYAGGWPSVLERFAAAV